MKELSIIIVHYQVSNLLKNCLISIEKFLHTIDYEIIVIDNNSPSDEWKKLKKDFPDVRFIENKKNEGFSKANNTAVSYTTGKFILLLNPDTEFESDGFKEIIDFATNKNNFGCLGVRMHDKQGNFLPESKRSVPNLLFSFQKLFSLVNQKTLEKRNYYRNDIDEYDIAAVEILTGAFMLMERETYLKIGGLDEQYFMYGEDIDLCYTLLQNGYQNYYFGKQSILHHKGGSTIKDKIYRQRFYNAMKIFAKKYFKNKSIFIYWIILIGIYIKKQTKKAS